MRTFQVVTVTFLALTLGHQAAADRWDADPNDGNDLTHAFIAPGQAQNGRDLESPQGTPGPGLGPDVARRAALVRGACDWGSRLASPKQWRQVGAARFQWRRSPVGDFSREFRRANDALGHQQRSLQLPSRHRAAEYQPGHRSIQLELFDTTYVVPRFNNSATQTTILIIHNNTGTAVTAFLYFYGAPGNLLDTEPVVIEPRATVVLNTSTTSARSRARAER